MPRVVAVVVGGGGGGGEDQLIVSLRFGGRVAEVVRKWEPVPP